MDLLAPDRWYDLKALLKPPAKQLFLSIKTYESLQIEIQMNFNGSNIFGTMKFLF